MVFDKGKGEWEKGKWELTTCVLSSQVKEIRKKSREKLNHVKVRQSKQLHDLISR